MKRINVDKISFSYNDKKIFTDFSLAINEGEFVAIVGANGSGKTTLLKLLGGILEPATGEITIDEININQDHETRLEIARNLLSVVLQNPEDQFVGATVEEDIAFGLENKSIQHTEMLKIITEVVDTLQLKEFVEKEPHQLSGGQKQRVAIASSLAMKTQYLLFDEATSQLDPRGKKEVLAAIQLLQEKYKKTIIMITHDLAEILFADRVIVLLDGVLVADVTPQELFSTYENQLEDFHLVLPKIISYSKALQNANLIDQTIFSVEELVEALCK